MRAGLAGRCVAAGEDSRWCGVDAGGLLGGAGGWGVQTGPVKSGFIFPMSRTIRRIVASWSKEGLLVTNQHPTGENL